jgi:integrase/recombinase XerD
VTRLIEAVEHPMYRMALLTAYAAGLRITELVALEAEHIDSARMLSQSAVRSPLDAAFSRVGH